MSGLPPIAPGPPAGVGGATTPPLTPAAPVSPATLAALTQVEPPAPTPQAMATPQAALQAAVQSAATTQGGLGSLMADLEAAVQSPATPQPVQAAASQVLAQQLPLDPPPSADDLKQAVAQSGLFLEAQLAQPDAQTAPSDLKSALLNLSQALESWSADVAQQAAQTPSAPMPAPTTAAATLAAQTLAPPPPYKGGPVRGQPPATAALPPDAPAEAIVARLRQDTTAALSRQTLMQAASAPDPAPAQTQPAAHWLFEIPLATQQGPAIAQFEIDRDGGQSPERGETDSRVWRARFSLDAQPMGPVHARIALQGGTARVTLWAEDAETATRLVAQQSELSDALLADQLEPQVQIVSGAPATPPPPSGRLMDKAV